MLGRNTERNLGKLKRLVCADIIEDARGFKRYVCYDRELNLYRYLPRNNFIKAIEKNEVEDAYLQKLRMGNVRINAKTHIEYEVNIQRPADYMILKPIDNNNSLFKLVDTRYNNDENITIPKCVVEVRPGALANCVGAKYTCEGIFFDMSNREEGHGGRIIIGHNDVAELVDDSVNGETVKAENKLILKGKVEITDSSKIARHSMLNNQYYTL